jgi:hypothetical protein
MPEYQNSSDQNQLFYLILVQGFSGVKTAKHLLKKLPDTKM